MLETEGCFAQPCFLTAELHLFSSRSNARKLYTRTNTLGKWMSLSNISLGISLKFAQPTHSSFQQATLSTLFINGTSNQRKVPSKSSSTVYRGRLFFILTHWSALVLDFNRIIRTRNLHYSIIITESIRKPVSQIHSMFWIIKVKNYIHIPAEKIW